MDAAYRATWETYVASWKAPSAAEKLALFERCLAKKCTYSDPLAHTEGWAELTAYMTGFHAQIPGGHFETQRFMAYGGHSLATWKMLGGDGTVIGDGASYGEYDNDGLLVKMVGFFDPPGEAP